MRGRTFVGILIVLIGVFLLLSQAGIYDFWSLVSDWWPMILIIAGVYSLVVNTAPLIGGLLLIFVGAWFQLGRLDLLPSGWNKFVFPVIIIIIGLYLLLTKKEKRVSTRDSVNHLAIFSGINARNESKGFKGGIVTAIFGGVDLDLTDAEIAGGNAEMDVTAAFGGVDLYVPRHWKVEVTGLPLFGGWGNKTQVFAKDEGAPVLRIKCLAMFGGVEIKSR